MSDEDIGEWTISKGERLRTMRKEAGLSQEKLARLLGVDRTHISKIENGVNGPSLRIMERWVAACGWDDAPRGSRGLENVQDAVREMGEEDLYVVAAFARFWANASEEMRERMRAFITL